jgi:alpha-D-ribose 1-methylphosphonate 5-triphosphate synthase subunit PhnL
MFAFQLMKNDAGKIAYNQTDRYIDVYLKDGKKIRNEVNTGNGYMSQNARIIAFVPSLTDKVVITDQKNHERTAYQSAALASK